MNNQKTHELEPLTLEDAITKFLFHCQYEKGLSPKTLIAYRIDLDQFDMQLTF